MLFFVLFNNMNIKITENLMQVSIIGVVLYFLYKKKTDINSIIRLIIIAGIIMRIGYMLYTPYTVRAHDIDGHIAYIGWLYNGSLPDNNGFLFYHPPFFHFLGSVLGRFIGSLKYDGNNIYEAAKIVSCFASCAMLIVTSEIARALELGKKTELTAVLITAFLPNFYLLAGRVNNDSLSVMFMYFTLLYTVKWYKKPCFKYAVIIALSIGFGMMTKMSVGTLAFFTGPVMLFVLFKSFVKDKKDLSIFCQLLVFAVICFPLGLWYPIRNMILFDQPLNYVYKIPADNPLYCGDYGIIDRFLSFPVISGLKTVYADPFTDHNVWIYLIKGALFGEFSFDINEFIPRVFTGINVILSVISASGLIFVIASKRVKPSVKYFVTVLWLVTVISYISFNISLPFGCTMDFRYVVPLGLVSSLTVGILYEALSDIWAEKENTAVLILLDIIKLVCILFAVYSVLMYTTIN